MSGGKPIPWGRVNAGIVIASCLGIALVAGLLTAEPAMESHTVHWWLDQAEGAACGYPGSYEALLVFRHNGKQALPGLLRIIEKPDSSPATWLSKQVFFRRLPRSIQNWAERKMSKGLADKCWAVMMCGGFGSEGKKAEPAIIRACADPNTSVRRSAAQALVEAQFPLEVALPLLSEMMLHDPYPEPREEAALRLAELGERARPALPALRLAASGPFPIMQAQWIVRKLEVENELQHAQPLPK